MDVKVTRLTKEGQTYHLAIYELGKDPYVITWEIGRAFVKITIPGLCRELEMSMGGKEHNEIMAAYKQRSERRIREILTVCLRLSELLMREKAGTKVVP